MKLHNPFAVRETTGLVISLIVVILAVIFGAILIVPIVAHALGLPPFTTLVVVGVGAAVYRVGVAVVKGE